jgi:hypothetical protein
MALLDHGSPQPTSAAPRLVHPSKPRHPGRLLYRRDITPDEVVRLVEQIGRTRLLTAINCISRVRRNGKRGNGQSNGHAETLAHHMERASLAEWQQAARVYGVDRIWDCMIAPVIAEERAAETNVTA